MVTNNIIKTNHQGTVNIKSQLKIGTTVTIELPTSAFS